jgi:hypothetical protein
MDRGMKTAAVQSAIERHTDGARMAKRDSGKRITTAATTTPDTATADAMEQRVLAFAEQLGRIVGTVKAKTEGWMDRDVLNQQIAGVRDSATELLEQLKTGVSNAVSGEKPATEDGKPATKNATDATAASRSKGRSGGIVDAPGKKHRKPTPRDSRVMAANAKASTARSGKSSMKTMKQRGRG